MSLINDFPEIKLFFETDKIDSNDLSKFIEFIVTKYENRALQKSALSLIKLEILKFEIELDENPNDSNLIQIKTTTHSDYLKHDIETISNKFEVSSSLLIELFRQRGVSKTKLDYITKKEYLLLEDFFKSKVAALKRSSKQEQRISQPLRKKVIKSIYRGIPVYNKISQNNGIGKLIYIRKR